MLRAVRVTEALAAIGAIFAAKYIIKGLVHGAKVVYCSLKSSTPYTTIDKNASKAEYVAILGSNEYAIEYTLQISNKINVIVICNDTLFEQRLKKMMEGKKIEHEVKIKCILNNDNSYKKLEETLTKIHIKTVISCIEADKYCYTGKFDTLSESDITDISNKYLNILFLLYYPLLRSVSEGGKKSAFIRLENKTPIAYAIGNGVLEELWKQQITGVTLKVKFNEKSSIPKTVRSSISRIGWCDEISQ